ncbi:MAG: hypothetical protein WAN36_03990 [Calditrichia bacterium]
MKKFLFEIPVQFPDSTPLFILGTPQSGRALVSRVLAKYLQIYFTSAFPQIIQIYKSLAFFEDFDERKSMEIIYERLKQIPAFEPCFRDGKLSSAFRQSSAEPDLPDFRRTLSLLLEKMAEIEQCKIWGCSSANIPDLFPVLNHLFPAARYLYLTCEQKDLRHSPIFHKEVDNSYHHRAMEVGRRLPAGRFLALSADHLLHFPGEFFIVLNGFLKIQDPGGQFIRFVSQNIRKDLPGVAGQQDGKAAVYRQHSGKKRGGQYAEASFRLCPGIWQ